MCLFQTSKQNIMLKTLDGLRGYAAILVLIAHIPLVSNTVLGELIYNSLKFLRVGYISVDMFFVLSGFLITRNLIKQRSFKSTISFKKFYVNRILRLFPVYLLVVLLSWLFIDTRHLIDSLLYFTNFTFSFDHTAHPLRHTWSLSIEEHFYLLWPVLIYFFGNKKNLRFIIYITLIIISSSLLFFFISFQEDVIIKLIQKSSSTRILSLVGGGTLAFFERDVSNLRNPKGLLKWAFAFFLFATFPRLILGNGVLYISTMYLFSFLGCITTFTYVLNVENTNSLSNKILTNRGAQFFGKISYSLYLIHYPIFYSYGMTKQQSQINEQIFFSLEQVFIVILICILTSTFSFYFIERPFLKYKIR